MSITEPYNDASSDSKEDVPTPLTGQHHFDYAALDEDLDLDHILNDLHDEKDDEKYTKSNPKHTMKQIDPNQLTKPSDPVGQGKFGKIYDGKWNDTRVAIKEYARQIDYLHEVRIIQHIHNTNSIRNKYDHLVKPFGFCKWSQHSELLIAEFMAEGSGNNLLHSNKDTNIRNTLNIADIVDILIDVSEGMRCLHSMDIIHRDLSARNLLFRKCNGHKKFTIKICDFGEAEIDQAKTHYRRGPYLWLSPESIRQQLCNVRTDIYSFGILCYELLVGSRPFPSTPIEVAIIEILCFSQRPNITSYSHLIPLPLFVLVQRCWQQIPKYRPRDFGDILDELNAFKRKQHHFEAVTTQLNEIKFDKENAKELLTDLGGLVSRYLSSAAPVKNEDDSDGHENREEVQFKTQMKQNLLKQMMNYNLDERTDIASINWYLGHFPWGESKTEKQQDKAAENVDAYTQEFGIKLKFINQK